MSLKIRLSRGGAKKRPFYKVVIAESSSPRDGRFIERVGSYDPMVAKDHPNRLVLNVERLSHWLSVGALPTERVARFMSDAGIKAFEKATNPQKAQPKKKALERLKEREEKAAALAEAAQAPAADGASEAPSAE